METFAPEDILIDNLSFKLNKGSSYIVDRRSVSFFPTTSNVYKPSSGARGIKFTLNGEDNSWLDPQSVRICFALNNEGGNHLKKLVLCHLLIPVSDEWELLPVVELLKILMVIIVFIICFSKLMSQGARRDEANEGFGYRYDDELFTLVNKGGAALTYEVNSANCPGFYNEMTCCFKPLCGLFSQFKYLPRKYMGNVTFELELVTNAIDCIINPNDYDESDTGISTDIRNRFTVVVAGDVGKAANTSIDWEISNPRVICDFCTLDNNLNNEYVTHLSEGKQENGSLSFILLHNLKPLKAQLILAFLLFVPYLNLLLLLSHFTKQETQAVVPNMLTKNFVVFIIHIKHTIH